MLPIKENGRKQNDRWKKSVREACWNILHDSLMVVGCGQGTQYASNVGEAITSNTETETSGTTALADTQDAAASDNKENFHTGGFWDYPDEKDIKG